MARILTNYRTLIKMQRGVIKQLKQNYYYLKMNGIDFRTTLQVGEKMKEEDFEAAAKICKKGQKAMKGKDKYKNISFFGEEGTSKSQAQETDVYWQLQSLRSVCLARAGKPSLAIQILSTCLQNKPHHTVSMRRLALLLKKQGDDERALEYYRLIQLYEPDNEWLANQLNSIKPEQETAKSHIKMFSSWSLPTMAESTEKQHVTFGSSEVIEMTSEHSDEYFAHIKGEVNKLSEIKPKKSILKASSGIFHKENSYQQSEPEEKEAENEAISLTKCLSIKSCAAPSPGKCKPEEFDEQLQKDEKPKFGSSSKKEKKKKKGVSFTFTQSDDQS